jgi:IclR family pca regulon transcriptional regulator
MSERSREAHFVQSVERALAVVRVFGADAPELTLSEVARATGLTRAAARRFLLTLVDLGYVRNTGRSFSLTPRVLELGYAYLAGLGLPAIAQPHLQRLVAEVDESTAVSVLDGEEIVCVARVANSRFMRISVDIGTRLPAYPTSMGRVLLAGLDDAALDAYLKATDLVAFTPRTLTDPDALRRAVQRARRDGYAVVEREMEEEIRSIAAPLRDRLGAVVGAVSLTTHVSRRTGRELRRELLEPLLATAAQIETDLSLAAP